MSGIVRILIVDDHQFVTGGLAKALNELPDILVTGQAGSLAEALAACRSCPPDLVVADVGLPDGSGAQLPARLRRDGVPVLLMSGLGSGAAREAVRSGAAGYIAKDLSIEKLVHAIRTVASGGTYFSQHDLALAREAPEPPTAREREVLALVVSGLANKEIGVRLGIEERTVETHLRRLFDRYGIDNRTGLAVYALREGWAVAGNSESGQSGSRERSSKAVGR